MAVTVYTMGVLPQWDMPEVLHRQLRLAHDLRQDLVSAQLAYDVEAKAIWSSFPAVATAEEHLSVAEETAAEASRAVNEARHRLRSKRVPEGLTTTWQQARAAVTDARQARRDAISAARPASESARKALLEQLWATEKALYAEYCSRGDLYWATANAVRAGQRRASKQVMKQRADGKPATLHHRRFDGTGTVAVQLQRPNGYPPRSPAELANPEGRYSTALHIPRPNMASWAELSPAEQRRAGRVTVRMRCGQLDGTPQWLDIPVQAWRWLPEDAEITGAELTVTRVASQLRARLAITAKVPDPSPVLAGAAAAVRLSWRTSQQGTVVASWRATTPLAIPERLRDVMVSADGRSGHVLLPSSLTDRLEQCDDLQSARDLALGAIRGKVADWLDEHGPRPYGEHSLTAAEVRKWCAPRRFAALARAWHAHAPNDELTEQLWDWFELDWRRWHRQERLRRRTIGHRADLYRQVAAVLARQCRAIAVDDTNLKELARMREPSRSELASDLQRRLSARRVQAAPASLRAFIAAAAVRDGVELRQASALGLSRTHAGCGHINPVGLGPGAVPCQGCGQLYEPDSSATILMLREMGW